MSLSKFFFIVFIVCVLRFVYFIYKYLQFYKAHEKFYLMQVLIPSNITNGIWLYLAGSTLFVILTYFNMVLKNVY